MPKSDKYRPLYVLKYLSEHTDENNTASLSDIIEYLKTQGMEPNRRTVDEDILRFSRCDHIAVSNGALLGEMSEVQGSISDQSCVFPPSKVI